LKLTHEIQHINQEHAAFKQKIQNDLLCLQNSSVLSGSSPVKKVAGLPSTVTSLTTTATIPLQVSQVTSTTLPVNTTSVSGDVFQSQMLQMLNDTFSKLSTVLTDSKNDTKTEWPKFSGEISKFRDTTNSQLNGKLYAKLLVCL
jgi:hypothetical protein